MTDGTQDKPVSARYRITDEGWVDIREAKPRCRATVPTGGEPEMVVVYQDGTLDVPDGVTIDPYEDYPEMRDEEVH